MSFVLVVFWFIVFAFLIERIIQKKEIKIQRGEVFLAFGIKVLLGCLYGYLFLRFYDGDDTWRLHANSITEKKLLLTDPLTFFSEFGPATAIRNGEGLVNVLQLYLVDLEYCLQAKTLGIINVISGENYFINVVFWNFILFWGHYWLFSLLIKEFPTSRQMLLVGIFLFPPVIFWLSGIRGDGLLLFFLALLLLHFYRWINNARAKSELWVVIGFAGLLIMRNSIAFLILPALVAWWITARHTRKPFLTFGLVYGIALILFFGSTLLPNGNLTTSIVKRQGEFFQLKGTAFGLDTLQPTVKSFIKILPQAAENTFLRPYPWEADGPLQWMASVEAILVFLIVILAIFRKNYQRNTLKNPFILVLLFFALTLYLSIGYTVPFPGAIVRYKIIGELFLLCIAAALINPQKRTIRLK